MDSYNATPSTSACAPIHCMFQGKDQHQQYSQILTLYSPPNNFSLIRNLVTLFCPRQCLPKILQIMGRRLRFN